MRRAAFPCSGLGYTMQLYGVPSGGPFSKGIQGWRYSRRLFRSASLQRCAGVAGVGAASVGVASVGVASVGVAGAGVATVGVAGADGWRFRSPSAIKTLRALPMVFGD